ncbi:MAG: glycerophosphoryl diester phosphodiesterase membrane domain-containing protein [Actinomycetota bacterium]|nr:glycerophosphoryl diester phosphodiesterase membrane domain-containing protein [Actinomycetota bacterium]
MDNSGGFNPPPPPPPPGGGMGGGSGGALPARGLGDILSAAFEIYKNNAAKLITIVAVVVVPLQFVLHLLTGVVFAAKKDTVVIGNIQVTETVARSAGVALLVLLIGLIIGVIINSALQAAIIRAAAQTTVGDPVDVSESYRFGFAHFGSVLLASILVGIVVAVGFVLLIVPGVIFLTMLAVTIPVVVIERKGVTDAMSRSWALAKGNFWHVLGTVVVAAIITSVVGGAIGAIGGNNWFLAWIFGSIGQIIAAPFSAMVTVLLYLDLRTRSESLTVDALRMELASNS